MVGDTTGDVGATTGVTVIIMVLRMAAAVAVIRVNNFYFRNFQP